MKKVSVALLMLCFVFSNVLGQTAMPIYDINREALLQTLGDSSFANNIWIRTSGVVTHVMSNGYYLQDAMGDDDLSTNDALFVRTDSVPSNVFTGNALTVRGLWYHDGNQTVLLPDSSHRLDQQMVTLNATSVTFPDDFTDYSQYVGMLLHFDQTLVVTSNYNWKRYGQLTLSSKRLITPTQAALPGSSDYRAIVTSNNKDQLIMDDGSDTSYPSPLPFADANGTRRTGSKITDLTAVMRYSSFGYNVVPNVTPNFWGNARPDSVVNLGDYNLKVCAFNLQYYLSSNYGTGYGPDNAADAQKQHAKILAACLALDCDIYGLVEVQTGQGAISQLCMALNTATGTKNYAYVNDGTSTNGSYTKVGYIYRQDKVEAVGQIQSLNTVVSNRKKAQAFKLKSNGEQFIYGLVHYKSKSGTGTGDNANSGDGQGNFNGDRVKEAEATVSFLNSCKTIFGESDVLLMGDFNAYPLEDPMQVLYRANYGSALLRFDADTAYSYSYQATVGALDQILANESMSPQITGASVFHINADEPSFLDYSGTYVNNMYRCSDHDPVVVGLHLGGSSSDINGIIGQEIAISPNPATDEVTIYNARNYRLRIFNNVGQLIATEFIESNFQLLSTEQFGLNKGIYLLQFKENKIIEPKTIVLKLIIN